MLRQLAHVTRKPWFAYFDLTCVAVAGGLWYLAPAAIPWTLPLSLGLTPWIIRFLFSGRLTRRTPFDWPLLLFLITAVISVWAAYDQPFAWQKFWLIVGSILLFYALANARALWPRQGPAAADQRLWAITGSGVILALYFMATNDWNNTPSVAFVEPIGRQLQTLLPPLPGHRLNPNVAGGMLAFVIPFAGSLLLTASQLPRRPIWGQVAALLALACILLGLLLTASRGAWLGLGAALAIWSLWHLAGWLSRWLWYSRRRRRRFQRQTAFFGLALLSGLLLPLLWLWVWPEGSLALADRWQTFLLTDLNRLALWRGGLILASDYPFTGSGLGGFMMLYSTYSLLIHVGHSFHAHNLYLNVAIEQGVPALLLLGWMWLLLVVALWRWLRPLSKQRQPKNTPRSAPTFAPALGAAALALLTILLHGLVDDAFYGSRALLLLFVPLAFAVPRPPRRRAKSRPTVSPAKRRPQVLTISLVLICLTGLLFWGRASLIGAWYANLGAVAQSKAELSIYSWPEWDIQDRVRQEVDLQPAAAYFSQALAANPQQATAHRRLGLIALANDEYMVALNHWQQAYQLVPWDNATRQWLGEAYILNGRIPEGAALWSTTINDNGQLSYRVYWYSQKSDLQQLARIQAAIELVDP